MIPHHVHVHSIRLASGEEALLARVVAENGAIGYGFSLALDATEARHMAERNAGVRPRIGAPPAMPPEIAAAARRLPWI